ncbi:DKNYY domain-containing protein [Cochleicola gelatinilyticus]|uniref:Uncharacterized protein n=1 Tax=Cochleicola gelatinilyticus TaxID=1763537 RepID=A0A167F1Y5_9FLAO|nr:DKNYY domain-containing protein [Cochleicola gelatinilyticus]OAB76104.1 hypothetical protein ULVI_13685 [Cochleicola gelatinilyticus]
MKNLVLFFCFVALFACKEVDKDISLAEADEQTYTQISSHLYRDSASNIYLKVKNKPSLHPSKTKNIKDSIFLSDVFEMETNKKLPLKQVIDTASFEAINQNGNYFKDRNKVYIYENTPKPAQFYYVPNTNVSFFGKSNDFMQNEDKLYFQGALMEGVDSENGKLVYLSSKKISYELFATDDQLYFDGIALDVERLKYLELPQETKDSLSYIYFH